jgi:uncharacterized OB-fold protein
MFDLQTERNNHARSTLLACVSCGVLRGYARPVCAVCHSKETHPVPLPARGTLYSLTTLHRAPTAALAALVPYTIGLVQGEAGGLLLLLLVGFRAGLPLIGDVVLIREGVEATGAIGLVASPYLNTTFEGDMGLRR